MTETPEQIDAAVRAQWQDVGNHHAACRRCGLVVFVGADATIEEHMAKCGPLAEPREKIKIDLSDPETRAIYEAAEDAKREVASWPAWKRSEYVK